MRPNEGSMRSTTNGSAEESVVTCSRCGQVLRHPYEWVKAENGTILCAMCYREILFPHTRFDAMEIVD